MFFLNELDWKTENGSCLSILSEPHFLSHPQCQLGALPFDPYCLPAHSWGWTLQTHPPETLSFVLSSAQPHLVSFLSSAQLSLPFSSQPSYGLSLTTRLPPSPDKTTCASHALLLLLRGLPCPAPALPTLRTALASPPLAMPLCFVSCSKCVPTLLTNVPCGA